MAKTKPADTDDTAISSSQPALANMKFETALAELEKIVQDMENGHLPLEASIAAYRRGSDLLGHCQGLLKEAEQKNQILENGALRDFDATGGDPR